MLVNKARDEVLKGRMVLVITLTNAARLEASDRVGHTLGVTVQTFHSFACDIVRKISGRDVSVVDEPDVWKSAIRRFNNQNILNARFAPRIAIDKAQPLATRGEYCAGEYDVILIDEYQDHSPHDYELLKLVSQAETHLFGDPLQTLFGFRQADPRAWRVLTESSVAPYTSWDVIQFPTHSESYRVPQEVIRFMNEDAEIEVSMSSRSTRTGSAQGVELKEFDPKKFFGWEGSTAVICRYNETIRDFAFDHEFYPVNEVSAGTLRKMKEEVWSGSKTHSQVDASLKVIEEIERVNDRYANDDVEIDILTVHRAKGREWDNVIFINDTKNDEPNIEYVAITRAKSNLVYVK